MSDETNPKKIFPMLEKKIQALQILIYFINFRKSPHNLDFFPFPDCS